MNNEVIVIVMIFFLTIVGLFGIVYIHGKDDAVMAKAGLEQCPRVPGWKGSGIIWVKDCDTYMKTHRGLQEK